MQCLYLLFYWTLFLWFGQFVGATVVLEWAAPFLSGGGYCSEAFAYIHALTLSTEFTSNHIIKAIQHGDSFNQQFVANMRTNDSSLFWKLNRSPLPTVQPMDIKISICHSEPGAWYTPFPNYHTQPCPAKDAHYRIGRTM